MKNILVLSFFALFIISVNTAYSQFMGGVLVDSEGQFVAEGTEVDIQITIFKNDTEVIFSGSDNAFVKKNGFISTYLELGPNDVDLEVDDILSYQLSVELNGETIETIKLPWASGMRSYISRTANHAFGATTLGNLLDEAEDDIPFLMQGTKMDTENVDYQAIHVPDVPNDAILILSKLDNGLSIQPNFYLDEFESFRTLTPDANAVHLAIDDGVPVFTQSPLGPPPTTEGSYLINISPNGADYIESPFPTEVSGDDDWYTFTLEDGKINVVLDPLREFNEALDDGIFVFDIQDGVITPREDNRPFVPSEPGSYFIVVDEFGSGSHQNYELAITPTTEGTYVIDVDDEGNPEYHTSCSQPITNPIMSGAFCRIFDEESGTADNFPVVNIANQVVSDLPPDHNFVDISGADFLLLDPSGADLHSYYKIIETEKVFHASYDPIADSWSWREVPQIEQPLWSDNGAGCRVLEEGPQDCTQINGSIKFEGAETSNFFDFTDGFGYYAIMGDGVFCADEYFLNPPMFTENQFKSGKSLNNIMALWKSKTGSKVDFVSNLESVYPSMVRKVDYAKINGGGIQKKVNLNALTPYITKAISEQQEIIDQQQKQIDDQQKQIDELRKMVESLANRK